MRTLGFTVLAFVGIVLVVLTLDRIHAASSLRLARAVRVGDSKAQVESILGRAPHVYDEGNFASWGYGLPVFDVSHAFRSTFPYFSSEGLIRFRLGPPDPAGVIVEFDSRGNVSRIKMP
jgi:hypothetical protein